MFLKWSCLIPLIRSSSSMTSPCYSSLTIAFFLFLMLAVLWKGGIKVPYLLIRSSSLASHNLLFVDLLVNSSWVRWGPSHLSSSPICISPLTFFFCRGRNQKNIFPIYIGIYEADWACWLERRWRPDVGRGSPNNPWQLTAGFPT